MNLDALRNGREIRLTNVQAIDPVGQLPGHQATILIGAENTVILVRLAYQLHPALNAEGGRVNHLQA